MDCILCPGGPNEVLVESDLVRVLVDGYPLAEGHMLVVPNRHVVSFFDLSEPELLDLYRAARIVRRELGVADWTLGVNDGPAAGRTIDHLHLHMIPRRPGDVPDPRGGIRRAFPHNRMPWLDEPKDGNGNGAPGAVFVEPAG